MILLVTAFNTLLLTIMGAYWGYHDFALENGPLELFQLLAIAVSGAAFAIAAWSLSNVARLACAWAVVVMIAMLQREVDFSAFGVDHWFHGLRSNAFRIPFWIVVGTIIAVWTLRVNPGLTGLRPYLRRSVLWVGVLIGGLLLLSQPIETASDAAETAWLHDRLLFAEELVETHGYMIMMLAALIIAWRAATLNRQMQSRGETKT